MNFFILIILMLLLILLVLRFYKEHVDKNKERQISKPKETVSKEFTNFKQSYLIAYSFMIGADQLQGPYVYALYSDQYGYSETDISRLFVVGFGTSMLFGCFVGSIADKYGRKFMCICYGILYSICCFTKHSSDFNVLLIGRFLGGISTSILFSAFESQMVKEFNTKEFPKDQLSQIFSNSTTINGLSAILAGIVGNLLRDRYGLVSPFDASAVLLLTGVLFIQFSQNENYGNKKSSVMSNVQRAKQYLLEDKNVTILGLIQSFFESAMYIFVFKQTPSLENGIFEIPHGQIFASFMTAIMIGSTFFDYICKFNQVHEKTAIYVFIISAITMAVPIAFRSFQYRFIAFIIFEICVGMFWPIFGSLRSKYVPEEVRATIMNLFRIPLNIIVVLVLLKIQYEAVTYVICVILLLLAAFSQFLIYKASLKLKDFEISEINNEESINYEENKPLLVDDTSISVN